MANENIQDIKDRVRALLMKAVDAAASPSEAEAAMRMAQKLMEKYQVSEADLGGLREDDWRYGETKAEHHKTRGYYLHPIDRYCSVVVGKFCGVIPYKVDEGTPQFRMVLFGLDADVELAQWMLAAFKKQLDHDWELYKRYQMESKRLIDVREARMAFVRGFTSAVTQRLNDWMFRDVPKAGQSPNKGSGHDLVLRKANLAIDELARRGIHLGATDSKARRGTVDHAAAGAGFNSGKAVQVGGQQVGGARIAIGR